MRHQVYMLRMLRMYYLRKRIENAGRKKMGRSEDNDGELSRAEIFRQLTKSNSYEVGSYHRLNNKNCLTVPSTCLDPWWGPADASF